MFRQMLVVVPELETGLKQGNLTTPRLLMIGNSVSFPIGSQCLTADPPPQIQRGAAASRGDDVKGIKAAIVDWISDPEKGLVPPIHRNQMGGRGFNHEVTGKALCPAGLDWNRYALAIMSSAWTWYR